MFDFSEFCGVANNLVETNQEAFIRSGISRYYYSGFGSAGHYLIYLMKEYEFISGFNIHQKICDRLMNSDDDTEVSIGEKLNELRKIRNEADYNWDVGFDYFNERLSSVQNDSIEILEQINTLKKSPPFIV